MQEINIFFRALYSNFNERKIESVIVNMTDNVKWANGMDGGYVYGRDEVREYWTKQFQLVSSKVTPLTIKLEGEVVKIKVHQVVHDLDGKLLADEIVYHYFHLENEKIVSFEIGERIKT
jgi:glutamate synthase domain-containing protein 3